MIRYYFEDKKNNKNFYLIIYDISDNQRRTKIAKILEGYGERVQMSAFELYISKRQYKNMMEEIERISENEDSIRSYPLNEEIAKNQKQSTVSKIQVDVVIA